jgi:hypothetical protein
VRRIKLRFVDQATLNRLADTSPLTGSQGSGRIHLDQKVIERPVGHDVNASPTVGHLLRPQILDCAQSRIQTK